MFIDIKETLVKYQKELVRSISFTFLDIDEVLSPTNSKVDCNVGHIYPIELVIMDTKDTARHTPYFDHTCKWAMSAD
jgi:hypothetical protein